MKSNYDIQLESILDIKKFNDEVKSLILNISYRIENSYKDFSKIKHDVKSKNDIMFDIIRIIDKKCNKISIVDPKSTSMKLSINRRNGIINVYPVDTHLLHALYFMDTNEPDKSSHIFEKTVLTILNKGYALDGEEVIRDFNGWSWNNNIDSKIDEYYNSIYQSLLLIIGNENLKDIIKSKNVLQKLNDKLDELYGEKNAMDVVEALIKVSMLIMISLDKKKIKLLDEYLEAKKNKLSKISNKAEYVKKIDRINKKYMEDVSKIDKLILNKKLLEKNFKKNKDKYNNLEEYLEHLNIIKNNKLQVITCNTADINPFKFDKIKKDLEREVRILEFVVSAYNIKEEVYYSFIRFERSICNCFYKKIEIYELKRELINLIYEFRYFNYLIVLSKKIKDIKELEIDIQNLQKKLMNRLTERKIIEVIAKESNLNYKILEYLFNAKMTNLNKINIKLLYNKNNLTIEYYDDNILEETKNISFNNDDYNELVKKIGKKIKVFIK